MPTKAQEFRSLQQRTANPPKPKQVRKPKRNAVPAAVEVTTDEATLRGRTRRLHAERRGGAVTEDPVVGKPSRKSTRKSSDGTKRTTNQQREAVRKATTPTAQATRSIAARPVRGRGKPAGGTRGAGKR